MIMNKRVMPFIASTFCFVGLFAASYSTDLDGAYYVALGIFYGFAASSILND
jgi:hypothetical protein